MPQPIDDVPVLVARLYAIVDELEGLFPGRPFTLDGHLVGSVGEVLAAHAYGLELLPPSHERHDAKAADGTLVQIKATQVDRISISSEPDHLLALRLFRDGSFEEIYNGPGGLAWNAAGKLQKNGQRQIGIGRLRKIMAEVGEIARLGVLR